MNYKVIALTVSGLGNKVFRAGEIVSESNFVAGRAEKLVESGFLARVDDIATNKLEAKQTDEAPAPEKIVEVPEKNILDEMQSKAQKGNKKK
jgi:hypothetical protein